ncbi:cysteine desulfurase [Marivibrio halodurans]|uniref:Cysteine desulfurase n=2 Tax=Marivibrio halodurans TaxID=2039722 RepID=A0A8J7V2K8_9PROT|nr:cysteine desulfurase [Marivibrio halodurans]
MSDETRSQGNRHREPIYLDYQATTPTDPRVVDAMLPWFTKDFGNPHSAEHKFGWDAAEAVDRAREAIAAEIGAKGREITFTSGATESNNLAIKGVVRHRREAEGRDRLVTVASEHKCVLESAARLEREGVEVVRLPIGADGLVDPEALDAVLDERVALVSVMAVNNEIGVIQPLAEIAARAHAVGAWVHTDAAQAFGKIPLDVEAMGIDLMSLSGHKIYGPKGIGALYLRRRKPKVALDPLMDGGGQERGVRSGTVPTPLVVGFGKAAAIATAERAAEAGRLLPLRDRLLARLEAGIEGLSLNGAREARIAGNLNVTIPGLEGQELMAALDGLAVSSGSACSSGAPGASHVLQALGLDPSKVAASIRLGLGRFTTEEEVESAAEQMVAAVKRLRERRGAA